MKWWGWTKTYHVLTWENFAPDLDNLIHYSIYLWLIGLQTKFEISSEEKEVVIQNELRIRDIMQNLFSWFSHVKNCPRKNEVSLTGVYDGLKINQDLAYFYADNFSRDKIKNKNSVLCLWFENENYIEPSLEARLNSLKQLRFPIIEISITKLKLRFRPLECLDQFRI